MKISWAKDRYGIIGMLCYTVMVLLIAILADGTCDNGDSIYHYLFARYSWIHPHLFLDHWGKPLFTLLASPFAQFGFIGIKLLNAFFSCISLWFCYLIAREMKYKWAAAVFVIAIFFKTFMIVTFSGLTEPLHNMMIAIAIYLAFTGGYSWAAIIVSFLPFVRSEGLFVCATFSIYLIWMRQWRILPLLLMGHVIYSLVGGLYYKDFLWVFNKIPYAHAHTHYGHGRFSAFVEAMPYIMAPGNCILLVAGVLLSTGSAIWLFLRGKYDTINIPRLFLVTLFLVFFMMHTTFWALGIFGSFGLIRVFAAIASVMILIVLSAIEYIDDLLAKYLPMHAAIWGTILVSVSLFFALGLTPFAYYGTDFFLHPHQQQDKKVAAYIRQNYPAYEIDRYFFDATYYSVLLDIDIFNTKKCSSNDLSISGSNYPAKSIVIWDDWYSRFEHEVPLEKLRNNKSLKEIKTFETSNPGGTMHQVVLFVSNYK